MSASRPDWDFDFATPTGDPAGNGHSDPTDGAERTPTSWVPVDLTDALHGIDVEAPKLWHRSDGVALLYRGRVHWFQGESESCKSWAAQVVAVAELHDAHDVLYVDFEDDERGVVARLRSLGATAEQITEHLVYVRPDEALRDSRGRYTAAWQDFAALLQARTYTLAVIDGVTEAMTTEGLELLDNANIAAWMRLLPKCIAATTGAAVVCIDHVTKASDGQGRYAIGGQHKLAGLNGAAYRFTTQRPLARALGTEPVDGVVEVKVMKDRPGWVRGRSPEGKVGTLTLTAWPDRNVTAALDPPGQRKVEDVALMGRILTHLATYDGSSKRGIREAVTGGSEDIDQALVAMVDRQWITVERKGMAHLHWLTDEGRTHVPDP